jgi:hypothetical protein
MSFTKKVLKFIPTYRGDLKSDGFVDVRLENLAILIHTCDKYDFCWEGWHYYFQKHWDFSLNCPVYFMNEDKEVKFPLIKHFPSGPGEWSDRLLRGLNAIPEKNILYLQEDFWLTSPIAIADYFKVFKSLSLNALRIAPDCDYYYLYRRFWKHGFPIHRFSSRSKYLVSHQASIWDKDFFISCLLPNENPWVNEDMGTRRMRSTNKFIKIALTPKNWYTATVRNGKFTAEGEAMAEIARSK